MDKYKIDWKDNIHGDIEIEASSVDEALEKFKSLTIEEIFKKSKWNSDGTELKVKFIENQNSPFDVYTKQEMKANGKEEIKEWDTFWRPLF